MQSPNSRRGGPRPGSGRKPVTDKKEFITVAIPILPSQKPTLNIPAIKAAMKAAALTEIQNQLTT